MARWIRYQEVVEEDGNRWSKPHVSTPSLDSWLQLRHHMNAGVVILDLDPSSYDSTSAICDAICEQLVSDGHADQEVAGRLKALLLKKHRHQFEGPRKTGTLSTVLKELLVNKLESKVRIN